MNRRKVFGFTLIELLIVVAIIAILAAIAVPNFLEAQVRAKVSRTKADQRTLATAIESYAIDWNRPPVGAQEANNGIQPKNWNFPGSNAAIPHMWSQITTPVAFLTSIPQDPFFRRPTLVSVNLYKWFHYEQIDFLQWTWTGYTEYNKTWTMAFEKGHQWFLSSRGPRRDVNAFNRPINVLAAVPLSAAPMYGAGKNSEVNGIYDSTNGTISFGNIMRTNKGIITQGG